MRSISFIGLALVLSSCGGGGNGGSDPSPQAPTLESTFPADTATAVPLNANLAAFFDQEMLPLGATTFLLTQGTASVAVSGAIATSDDGTSATFAPGADLAVSSQYTATITIGATSAEGVPFAVDRSWTFTTGTSGDISAPEVTSTNPDTGVTAVATNTTIAATFSKAMDPLSIGATSFTVMRGATAVAGSVSYGPGTTATFTPSGALASGTVFTATIAGTVRDLQGNTLAGPHVWSFTTGTAAAKGPARVNLGTAGKFAILTKAGISTVPASSITGDIGVSPAAATYLTGFSLTADATNVFSTSPQIIGRAYAANYAVPTPSNMTTAIGNIESAYTDAQSRPGPNFLELGTGNIGGKNLVPGLYKWTSTVTIPSNVTLTGGPNDVWIFQTTGDLNLSPAKMVILAGGAQAKNVFWVVAGKTIFGSNSHFEGILLCKTDVTLQTGSSMKGRILAQTHVALQQATVTQP